MHEFLEKHLDEHRRVGAVTAVFLGDSVTHGCFESNADKSPTLDYEAVYHNRFRQMVNDLGFTDKKLCINMQKKPINVINSGINGDSAGGALGRLDRDVIRYSPDLCVVNLALNNVWDDIDKYAKCMNEIFAKLKQAKIPTVFLTCNRMCSYVIEEIIPNPDYRQSAHKVAELQLSGKLDRVLEAGKTVAYKNGAIICDANRRWNDMEIRGIDTTRMLANGINHPTRELHGLFAGCLLNTLMTGEE